MYNYINTKSVFIGCVNAVSYVTTCYKWRKYKPCSFSAAVSPPLRAQIVSLLAFQLTGTKTCFYIDLGHPEVIL